MRFHILNLDFRPFSHPWASRDLPVVVLQQASEAFPTFDFSVRAVWIMVGGREKQPVELFLVLRMLHPMTSGASAKSFASIKDRSDGRLTVFVPHLFRWLSYIQRSGYLASVSMIRGDRENDCQFNCAHQVLPNTGKRIRSRGVGSRQTYILKNRDVEHYQYNEISPRNALSSGTLPGKSRARVRDEPERPFPLGE